MNMTGSLMQRPHQPEVGVWKLFKASAQTGPQRHEFLAVRADVQAMKGSVQLCTETGTEFLSNQFAESTAQATAKTADRILPLSAARALHTKLYSNQLTKSLTEHK